MSKWVVGTDRDDEFTARFDSEPAAIAFAEVDSQLEDRTAVVIRHDPDGTATVVAEFLR
jgi:hypothetical protein